MSTKILHISDWHLVSETELTNKLWTFRKREQPDIVVITGDMMPNSQYWRNNDFLNEAKFQRHIWEEEYFPLFRTAFPRAKFVAVPGNHDYCNYTIENEVRAIDGDEAETFDVDGIVFTGWRGSPDYDTTPSWKWDRQIPDKTMAKLTADLDPKANVLITHTPAYGLLCSLDHPIHYGSVPLRKFLDRKDLGIKHHLFGHAHERGGKEGTYNGIHFSNAAVKANWIVIEK